MQNGVVHLDISYSGELENNESRNSSGLETFEEQSKEGLGGSCGVHNEILISCTPMVVNNSKMA